jgi:hypothetical protein
MPYPNQVLVLLLLPAALMASRPLRAQSDSVQRASCSYDACALRQDGGAIRRGLSGEKVANIGVFSATNLSSIVRGDSATSYARLFNREYRRGNRMMWGGLALTEGAVIAVLQRMRDDQHFAAPESVLVGVALGGFVISQVGSKSLRRARTAASKALWWHNRDLSR